MALDYLIDWIRIRKGEYISILVADNQGALVVSSSPRAAYDQSKSLWWQSSYRGGSGQVYVSDLNFDPMLGHYVIMYPRLSWMMGSARPSEPLTSA